MERLRQSDLHSLLAFVHECYAFGNSGSFDNFVPRLAAACLRLIPTAHVTYNEMIPERAESRNYITTKEIGTPEMDRLWEQHMHEQPVLTHVLKTGDRRARRISDFIGQRQFHQKGLYYDFYRLAGIEDSLCISVPCPPPRFIGVAWHGDRAFTERERLIADLVRPHISQAWHNARIIDRQRRQLKMLERGADSLGVGVVLFSSQGKVQFINAQARQYLVRYFGIVWQTDRQLPEDLQRWVRAQELPLNRVEDALPVRTPLVLEKENERLVVRLLSEPGQHLILMQEEQRAPDGNALAAFALTVRETEVLGWISRGKTNQEIAMILQMHTATVKKHVEHILTKLGVETRTAAAAVVLRPSPLEKAR
jgi:DNA-binding CsgD family transcriptional regulator